MGCLYFRISFIASAKFQKNARHFKLNSINLLINWLYAKMAILQHWNKLHGIIIYYYMLKIGDYAATIFSDIITKGEYKDD